MTARSKKIPITLHVNGRVHEVLATPNAVLLHTLRKMGYTDVKNGCEIGECGACAVLLDGQAVNSCMVLTAQADGAEIVTDAGLGTMDKPHPIQEAFAKHDALQCGFCTPGMILNAYSLLLKNPEPSRQEIIDGMEYNLCRCGAHIRIIRAIEDAALEMKGAR